MPKSFGETTAPGGASTAQSAGSIDCMALVLVWSASEPHRVGEIAFFPFGERLLVGRGDAEIEKFACFVRHRPGEELAVDPREALLAGDSISRRQLRLRSTGVELEMEKIGRCRTYVNGEEREKATLHPGDTVLLKGEALLLCVRRPKVLARLPGWRELHPFGQADADFIAGESPGSWDLRRQIAHAARAPGNVLVLGESGTGKELVAGAVHRQSDRAKGPFVSDNVSDLSPALIASELFGNRAKYPNPGAEARTGLVGAADGGMLFLDEIGDCPEEAQTQLLRVMELGEYRPVGEATARRVDMRLVGATNKPESSLRKDFFARFLARVRVPPLRDRREDIPLIVRHWLVSHANSKEFPEIGERFLRTGADGRLQPKISARLVDHLVRHPLPLNARQIHTILVEAINASPGDELRMPASANAQPSADAPSTRPASLLPEPQARRGSAALGPPPKEEVIACLRREQGNIARAAKALGVTRQALYELMESYGMKKEGAE